MSLFLLTLVDLALAHALMLLICKSDFILVTFCPSYCCFVLLCTDMNVDIASSISSLYGFLKVLSLSLVNVQSCYVSFTYRKLC